MWPILASVQPLIQQKAATVADKIMEIIDIQINSSNTFAPAESFEIGPNYTLLNELKSLRK